MPSSQLDPLIFEQPAHELCARILGLIGASRFARGQQHARFDFDQQRGHQQILRCEFEILGANLVDIGQVLHRQRRHRNVEHVEVLLANQIQQQIKRPLERFQKNFECVGRNVQIIGQPEQRLAVEPGQRN